jgi:hypothetical protein
MKKILFLTICLVIGFTKASAQKVTLTFDDVSLSEALKRIDKVQDAKRINFIFDELEDFRVTKKIQNQSVEDAVRSVCGYYPMSIAVQDSDIFVECVQKAAIRYTGNIVDAKGQPLAFANVSLLNPKDSAFITGGVSNENGSFTVPCDANTVLARITYMGFRTIYRLCTKAEIGKVVMRADSKVLEELTVTGARIINKVDRQYIIPTENMVKGSSNGYDLLQRMSLKGIMVDPVNQTIKSNRGGGVQIRVNDIKANSQDIMSIRPDEVVRVEYVDMPGVRYGDWTLDAVINYVVKRRYAGYVGGVKSLQAFTSGFNNTNSYFKYNYKLSEFSISHYLGWRDVYKRYHESKEEYIFPDGETHKMNYDGVYSPFWYAQNIMQAAYNLAKPDIYTFNASFYLYAFNSPKRGVNSIVSETGKDNRFNYEDRKMKEYKPSLDLYYFVNLPKKQTLAINAVGTIITTRNEYGMSEYILPQNYVCEDRKAPELSSLGEPVADYYYSTNGKKHSLITEAIYTKETEKVNISVGGEYTIGFTDNKYVGSTNAHALIHNNNEYLFAQIQGNIPFGKKEQTIGYQLGIGANRSSIHQGDFGYDNWMIRPQLTVSIPVCKNANIKLQSRITPNEPSLANVTDVRQYDNSLFIKSGNKELKPSHTWYNEVSLGGEVKNVEYTLEASWSNNPNALMNTYTPEKEANGNWVIVSRPENHKRLSQSYIYGDMTWKIFPDKWHVSFLASYDHYESIGNTYRHFYNTTQVGFYSWVQLGNFSMDVYFLTQPHYLTGEFIQGGEKRGDVNISYKWKDLKFSLGCMLVGSPMGFDYNYTINNKWYKTDAHLYYSENGNMLHLSASWNFSHGRKYKAADRILNNKDNDSGVR